MTQSELNDLKSQLDCKFDSNFTLDTLGISSSDFIEDCRDTLMNKIVSACQDRIEAKAEIE